MRHRSTVHFVKIALGVFAVAVLLLGYHAILRERSDRTREDFSHNTSNAGESIAASRQPTVPTRQSADTPSVLDDGGREAPLVMGGVTPFVILEEDETLLTGQQLPP